MRGGKAERGTAEFLGSATQAQQYPRLRLPAVGFAGRSNVGKSSLINRLTGCRGLARISSAPGRTQTLNFYKVANRWLFVDLPGYGFAKVPRQVRARWRPMVEEFFQNYDTLRMIVVVVDARHEASSLDRQMIAWLEEIRKRYIVAATKIDKLRRAERSGQLSRLAEGLGVEDVVPVSAASGEGIPALWRLLEEELGS
ncbi:MAG: ribosome biogenesis GTP-binding protein YihA/YsxC [Acidobacteriota bacterium]